VNLDDSLNGLSERRRVALAATVRSEHPRVFPRPRQLPVLERRLPSLGERRVRERTQPEIDSPTSNGPAPDPLLRSGGLYSQDQAMCIAILARRHDIAYEDCREHGSAGCSLMASRGVCVSGFDRHSAPPFCPTGHVEWNGTGCYVMRGPQCCTSCDSNRLEVLTKPQETHGNGCLAGTPSV